MSKFVYGKRSERNLVGVHPDLVAVMRKALSYGVMDIAVIAGVRTEAEQRRLYNQGRITPGPVVTWTMNSKHRVQPTTGYGHAVDSVAYPVDWDNLDRFFELAKVIRQAADELNVKLRWGGDFKRRKDYPHWEIVL